MVPQYFQAEETGDRDEARPSLLGKVISQPSELVRTTVKETTDVVEVVLEEATVGTNELTEEVVKTVDTPIINASEVVNQATKTLPKPSDNTTTSAVVKETINVVKDATKNTKSVVNKTSEISKETIKATKKETKDVTKTISRTIETIDDTTDEVINELPPIPVVTPMVKEVKDQITDAVEPLVEKPVEQTTEKPVEQTTEKPVKQADITPTQTSDDIEMVPDSDAMETIVTHPVSEIDDNPVQSEDVNAEIVTVPEDSFVATKTPIENKPLSKIKILKLKSLSESLSLIERVDISANQSVNKTTKEETSTQSVKLVSQNQNQERHVFLTEPLEITLTPPNLMNSSHSSTSSAGISDGVQGILLLLPYQSDQVNERWHHGNKFALKQWIYDPLGQPPKFAPFLID